MIQQIESMDELRKVDPLRLTRPRVYGLRAIVATSLVLRFDTDGLWPIVGISRRLAHLTQGGLVYQDAQPNGAQSTLALPAA
jgi:hypothetical protein